MSAAPANDESVDQQQVETDRPSGKGRPTPKRSDARKRRRTATPTSRKEAAKLRRERMREQRSQQRQALLTGDERHLPARDAGPARRLARDFVDSRFTLGQVFFGIILIAFAVAFVPNRAVGAFANLVMLLLFAGMVVDSARVGRAARRAVEERYGAKDATGVTTYAMMRAMQPRRMRRPPARVKRGDATS
ncbi:MAG TPA: DUF3043 domain-containing protein [Mycobacteriales bacterium]|nr:DUF3043 domain-containing protein [Mycobacteriales bacterium]